MDLRALADGLFAEAMAVDAGDRPVAAQLDRLADAGLYGTFIPADLGGLGLTTGEALGVVEALAGGCLTTAFVWIQHQGVSKRVVAAGGEIAARWAPRLASGSVRAGVGVGGVRPPSPTLHASRDGDGYRLSGSVPWISGWGLVDVILVAAVEVDGAGPAGAEGGDVLWLLMDAPTPDPAAAAAGRLELDGETISLQRYDLVALDRAQNARVVVDGHRVPADRLVRRQAYDDWQAADAAGLRTNGSLPLGVAARCAVLLGDRRAAAHLDLAVTDHRRALDDAVGDPSALADARAAAAGLVWEAAALLLADAGGPAVARSAHAQRLAREAMVLQVFGTRPAITEAMIAASVGRLETR